MPYVVQKMEKWKFRIFLYPDTFGTWYDGGEWRWWQFGICFFIFFQRSQYFIYKSDAMDVHVQTDDCSCELPVESSTVINTTNNEIVTLQLNATSSSHKWAKY